jgi:hypothetical protein
MNKMAIYVEGQTELIFIKKLIKEMAQNLNFAVETFVIEGGTTCPKTISKNGAIKGVSTDSEIEFYVGIYNCRQDERVVTEIKANYSSLVKKGFSTILGIRDVYPNISDLIPKLRMASKHKVKTSPINPIIILATMEVEAWFLNEHHHYSSLHENLNNEVIKTNLGFSPKDDDLSSRFHPSQDLHEAYQLVGLAYKKDKYRVSRTVDNLSYENLYLEVVEKNNSFKELVDELNVFFNSSN